MSKHGDDPIRRARFVIEYVGLIREGRESAAEAARRAGFAPSSAKIVGARLVKRPEILAEIERRTQAELSVIRLDRKRLLQELEYIATADPVDALDENGTPRSIHEMPERYRRALSGVDVVEFPDKEGKVYKRVTKVRQAEKRAALESVARMHGWLVEKHEHDVKVGYADLLRDAEARAAQK